MIRTLGGQKTLLAYKLNAYYSVVPAFLHASVQGHILLVFVMTLTLINILQLQILSNPLKSSLIISNCTAIFNILSTTVRHVIVFIYHSQGQASLVAIMNLY